MVDIEENLDEFDNRVEPIAVNNLNQINSNQIVLQYNINMVSNEKYFYHNHPQGLRSKA